MPTPIQMQTASNQSLMVVQVLREMVNEMRNTNRLLQLIDNRLGLISQKRG